LSAEAFGVWRRMLNLMHEGLPYGHLTLSSGQPIDPAMLGRLTGYAMPSIKRSLKELEAAAVFSRRSDGVIFSRRMVRDEHNRNVRAAGGGRSLENPNVPRPKESESNGRIPSDRPSDGPLGDPLQ